MFHIKNYDSGLRLVYKFICTVFPAVDIELGRWMDHANRAGDEEIKKQALSSISRKKFHAQGGCVYSLYPGVQTDNAVKFIVSLQTISDYLDNLCDRAGVLDESAFRHLHLAMSDAISPDTSAFDYYRHYPLKNDNGYLESLVGECKRQIRMLPSYKVVEVFFRKYVRLYSCLQIRKHLDPDLRESFLKEWVESDLHQYGGSYWWELCASAGSTLGIFLLFAAASDPGLAINEIKAIDEAYFPWVCGLHILLDYYIDSDEDLAGGDLNFTRYYKDLDECKERLAFFIGQAFIKCEGLRYPEFHFTVINGLLAMYLSDPKAVSGSRRDVGRQLLKTGKRRAGSYYHICRLLRRMGKL